MTWMMHIGWWRSKDAAQKHFLSINISNSHEHNSKWILNCLTSNCLGWCFFKKIKWVKFCHILTITSKREHFIANFLLYKKIAKLIRRIWLVGGEFCHNLTHVLILGQIFYSFYFFTKFSPINIKFCFEWLISMLHQKTKKKIQTPDIPHFAGQILQHEY